MKFKNITLDIEYHRHNKLCCMCGKQQFKYSNTQKPGKPPELELDMEFFQKSKEYPGEYLCKRCYANNTEALFKIA